MIYVALGDSITFYRKDVTVYYELLEQDKQELGLTKMVNSGVGGWKTSDLISHLESKCLSYKPDIITLMLGTNDHAIYKGTSEPAVSLWHYETNLRLMVELICRSKDTNGCKTDSPKVILMTPPYIATYVHAAGTDLNQLRLKGYCQVVEKLSKELKTGFVDIYAITANGTQWDDQLYMDTYTDRNDGCHLNNLGHQLIYPHIKASLKQALSRSGLALDAFL